MKTIGIINPSMIIEPFCPTRFKRASDNLIAAGYKLKFGKLTKNTTEIYRSGTIKERSAELMEMVLDEEVDIIMVSIGGQNTASILDYLDYDLIKKHPKKYIAYSDGTSLLHALKVKAGQQVYYGMSLTSSFGELGYFATESLKQLDQCLTNKSYEYQIPKYVTNQYIDWEEQNEEKIKYPNECKLYNFQAFEGRIVGGNLTTLCALTGTEYLIERQVGDILYLETEGTDIGMIEKYLVQLKQNKYFDNLAGIILGKTEFIKDYGLQRDLYTIMQEIIELAIPVYDGFDAAHTHPSTLIELGSFIRVNNDGSITKIC